MNDIRILASHFRKAIEAAKEDNVFNNDIVFRNFPIGCCGDSCDLLAQFFLENNIALSYVLGTYRDGTFEDTQSHSWLLVDNQIIVDITGDQFRYFPSLLRNNVSVYVGVENDFYRLFEIDSIYVHKGITALGDSSQNRLTELYRKIKKYI